MMNLDRVAAGLSRIGMNVETKTGEDGKPTVVASIETGRGLLSVLCVPEGARLGKPNGSSKYLYECSESKLWAVVEQTIKANR